MIGWGLNIASASCYGKVKEATSTYNDSVRSSWAYAPSDSLKALLDIDYQTAGNRRCIDPLPVLVEYLQASRVILGEKSEESGGVFMRPNSLRVRC